MRTTVLVAVISFFQAIREIRAQNKYYKKLFENI
jgi:hypothetical protein